jgi:zinc transporter ZupT
VQPRRPLAWAATLSIAATLAAAPGAFAPDGPRAALHWLPVAAAALVAAVLRAALPGTLRGEADSGAA